MLVKPLLPFILICWLVFKEISVGFSSVFFLFLDLVFLSGDGNVSSHSPQEQGEILGLGVFDSTRLCKILRVLAVGWVSPSKKNDFNAFGK